MVSARRLDNVKQRPISLSSVLILVTIAAGLTLRMAPLGLPAFVVKYGGSTMWALMIYWLVTTVAPTRRIAPAVLLSGCIACAVEFFKLYRSPGVDAFRATLAGELLLGRYFSVKDLVVYAVAIAAGATIDLRLRRGD